MLKTVRAKYANGVFMPAETLDIAEGTDVSLTVDAGEASLDLREATDELLAAAAREFEHAFGGAFYDADAVRKGSRLAWEAARLNISEVARMRGWTCETFEDARTVMHRMDGIESDGDCEGRPVHSIKFTAAEGLYEHAFANVHECMPLLWEDWQFNAALVTVRELADLMATSGVGEFGER